MTLIDTLHKRIDDAARIAPLRGIVQRQARSAFIANRDENLFFGIHPTWAEAEQAAHEFGKAGYNNPASAELYDNRMRMDAYDYPSLYWINRSLQEGMKGVFDVGGAVGIKFTAFRERLQHFSDLTWLVQDVPTMVAHGRELAAQRGDDARLQFTERFEDGEGLDLLFASGVLQYLPKTLSELLGTYQRLPSRIVINTTAIHADMSSSRSTVWALAFARIACRPRLA